MSAAVAAAALAATAALALGGAAAAQTTPASAAPAEAPICADRPTKATVPCTAPAGDIQIESDLVNWSRVSADGASTTTTLFTNPTLKYGVSPKLDVEVNWAPWEKVRATSGGHATTSSGVGDVYARAKWALLASDAVSVSVEPWVKLPTANHQIGNGHVEGGLVAPVSLALPAKFTLVLGPELDVLENAALTGAHLNVVDVINVSRSVGKWTFFAELWNDQNFDPSGTTPQTTADVGAAWLLTNTLQLDVGANFGLDRQAPGRQVYLGVAQRF